MGKVRLNSTLLEPVKFTLAWKSAGWWIFKRFANMAKISSSSFPRTHSLRHGRTAAKTWLGAKMLNVNKVSVNGREGKKECALYVRTGALIPHLICLPSDNLRWKESDSQWKKLSYEQRPRGCPFFTPAIESLFEWGYRVKSATCVSPRDLRSVRDEKA